MPPPQISVYELGVGLSKKLIVVKKEGSLYCGTTGCDIEFYNLDGKLLYEVSTHEIFMQNCALDKPLFIFYDGKKYVRWNILGTTAKL